MKRTFTLAALALVVAQDPGLGERRGVDRTPQGWQALEQQDPERSKRVLTVKGAAGHAVQLPFDLFTGDALPRALAQRLGLVESLRAAGRDLGDRFELAVLAPEASFRVGDVFRVETYDRVPLLVSQKLLIDCDDDLRILAGHIADCFERKREGAAGPPWSDHPSRIRLEESGSTNYERITIHAAPDSKSDFYVEMIVTRRQGPPPRYQVSLQAREFDEKGIETFGGAADLFVDEAKRSLRALYPVNPPK